MAWRFFISHPICDHVRRTRSSHLTTSMKDCAGLCYSLRGLSCLSSLRQGLICTSWPLSCRSPPTTISHGSSSVSALAPRRVLRVFRSSASSGHPLSSFRAGSHCLLDPSSALFVVISGLVQSCVYCPATWTTFRESVPVNIHLPDVRPSDMRLVIWQWRHLYRHLRAGSVDPGWNWLLTVAAHWTPRSPHNIVDAGFAPDSAMTPKNVPYQNLQSNFVPRAPFKGTKRTLSPDSHVGRLHSRPYHLTCAVVASFPTLYPDNVHPACSTVHSSMLLSAGMSLCNPLV